MAVALDYLLILIKRKKLLKVRVVLKLKFVGIDDVIDTFIDSVSNWYLTPELMLRPNIICLWGITGVGKTDLIRTFVKLLLMLDSYVLIQFEDSEISQYKTIQDSLYISDLKHDSQGILLLDLFQRYRTVDDEGHLKKVSGYSDLWLLLSDGKFSSGYTKKSDIMLILNSVILEYLFYLIRQDRKKKLNTVNKITVGSFNGEILEDEDLLGLFRLSNWMLHKIKKIIGNKHTMKDLVAMGVDTIIQLLLDISKDQIVLESKPYNKFLIVISGNLDLAYHFASWAQEADMDADIIYRYSKEVDLVTIKLALKRRFKPLQISRFGNNHIIYKTLTKQAYNNLINRKLLLLNLKIFSLSRIKIVYDTSINQLIYDNGVFPCQGVRPLLSTISIIILSNIPNFLIYAMSHNLNLILLTSNDNSLSFKHNELIITVSVIASIDLIRKKRTLSLNMRRLVAVHLTGHALLYALNYNVVPLQITIRTSGMALGFVYTSNAILSRDLLFKDVEIKLAGNVAEKLIFGQLNVSTGAESDLYKATKQAAEMKRTLGMCSSLSTYLSPALDHSKFYNTNILLTNELILKILQICAESSKNKIVNNMSLFIDISNELYEKLEISSLRFYLICQSHKLQIKMHDKDKLICKLYNDLWNKLISNNK